MARYNITLQCTVYTEMTVKANTLEAAKKKAEEQLQDMEWTEYEITDGWKLKGDTNDQHTRRTRQR